MPGVVQNAFEYGLFIDLPNTIVAFAPQKYLGGNATVGSSEKKYRSGQSVLVRILQLDETKRRCIVTLKSIAYEGEMAQLTHSDYVLRQYLDEKYRLIEAMRQNGTGTNERACRMFLSSGSSQVRCPSSFKKRSDGLAWSVDV